MRRFIAMPAFDHDFKTVCQRAEQAARRIVRQQALMAMLIEKGQPVAELENSLHDMHETYNVLRVQRAEMARRLRGRARRRSP